MATQTVGYVSLSAILVQRQAVSCRQSLLALAATVRLGVESYQQEQMLKSSPDFPKSTSKSETRC
jgi:hypothetical protein